MPLPCTRRLPLSSLIGLLSLFLADDGRAAATAEEDKDGLIEEILVTARRRDETSIAVPMTLTYIDGATLDGLQFHDLDDILSLSPGVLVYGGGDGVSSQITIRGVVTPGASVEPGNAVYVDEVYVSGMYTILPGFYDIQSVQVLKGPQAGLYGRNTIGGAVVVTTGQPTDELSGRVDASYAQLDTRETSGTINLPLSDAWRIRGTGWYSDSNGGYYQDKIFDQNLDTTHESGGRLAVAFQPGDRLALALTGEYADIDNGPGAAVVKGARWGPPDLGPESSQNVLRDDIGGIEQDSARINGRLNVDGDAGTLQVVGGWRRVTVRVPNADFDGTASTASAANPPSALTTPAPQASTLDGRNTSRQVEVRILTPEEGSSLKALVGASYFEETLRFNDALLPVRALASALDELALDGSFEHHADQKTQSWAGFGEVILTPVAMIEVTADLRYTRDHKKLDSSQSASGLYSSPLVGLLSYTLDTNQTFDNWSPGITLAYKPDDDLTVFAKYVRGFRAGGFNLLVYDLGLVPYDSEKAENYELGCKTLLFDQRLALDASVFYLEIDNALAPYKDSGILTPFYPLTNGGKAQTTGLELGLTAGVATGLTVSASAGAYQYDITGLPALNRRPFAPSFTASMAADYQHPLTSGITGRARAGYRYRSGGKLPSTADLDSYHLLDAQVGVGYRNTEVAVFVSNALNDQNVAKGGLDLIQGIVAPQAGIDPDTAHSITSDPGSVYGVRITAAF